MAAVDSKMDVDGESPEFAFQSICAIVESSGLEHSIRAILDKNIGPSWHALIKCPASPWPAHFMIKFIDQHWNAVFANFLPRSARSLASACLRQLSAGMSISANRWSFSDTNALARNLKGLLLMFGLDISTPLDKLVDSQLPQPLSH
jgi:hypothetical protein